MFKRYHEKVDTRTYYDLLKILPAFFGCKFYVFEVPNSVEMVGLHLADYGKSLENSLGSRDFLALSEERGLLLKGLKEGREEVCEMIVEFVLRYKHLGGVEGLVEEFLGGSLEGRLKREDCLRIMEETEFGGER